MYTHGFPNFFRMSLVQAGIGINYIHIADAQMKHIAFIISECRNRGAASVEPTQKAEDDWVETIVSGNASRRAFLEACTPGYFNYEGKRRRSVELNEPFGGGAVAYLKILDDWRKDGTLKGLELIRKP
jgi:cyclohexanone monooxygenase